MDRAKGQDIERKAGQLWMYQGNLVKIVELNGCLARVTVVDEEGIRPFAVGQDDLVDLEKWLETVERGDVEAPAHLLMMVRGQVEARKIYGRPIQGLKVNVMEPGRLIP